MLRNPSIHSIPCLSLRETYIPRSSPMDSKMGQIVLLTVSGDLLPIEGEVKAFPLPCQAMKQGTCL
jgi:hypothetical protein